MDKLLIGEILKPRGIRGEVKMKNYTDGFSSICDIKEVFIDDLSYEVLKMRSDDKDVYLFLRGIYDRDDAEKLRGKDVYAIKDQINIEENRYFISDVLGCSLVFEDGEVFGVIDEILSARTDIYFIKCKEGRAIMPLVPSLNAQFDIENKRVTVLKEEFLKELSYEN